MKHYSFIIWFIVLLFISCTPNWVRELKNKDRQKDCANNISVYFHFDTIINNFKVSGILYPNYSEEYGWSYAENGVRLFFSSTFGTQKLFSKKHHQLE